jgi:hypothetical protein
MDQLEMVFQAAAVAVDIKVEVAAPQQNQV